ncbi:MAG: DUF2628 domain-containing protein, partial [bacterium]|nr:DUF2628 domain-containing protein [bacterium]
GYNQQGYNQQGYNNQGYNHQGPNNQQGYQNQNANSNQQKENSFFGADLNPFKSMKQQQTLPEIKTEEQARDVYYGINQEYYKKVYKNYKAGKKVSWNWSAFIFRSYWFFSRKMYAMGSLYTVAMSLITLSVYQIYDNITNPNVALLALPWGLVSIVLWVLSGMFGNYIYMAHMENKIVYPNDRDVSKEKVAQLNVMRGGFSIYGVLLCFVASDLILTLLQALLGLV